METAGRTSPLGARATKSTLSRSFFERPPPSQPLRPEVLVPAALCPQLRTLGL